MMVFMHVWDQKATVKRVSSASSCVDIDKLSIFFHGDDNYERATAVADSINSRKGEIDEEAIQEEGNAAVAQAAASG